MTITYIESHGKDCGCTNCTNKRIEPYKKLAYKHGDIVEHPNGSRGVICEVSFSGVCKDVMWTIRYAIHWFEKTDANLYYSWFGHPELILLYSTWDNFNKRKQNATNKHR